MKARAVISIVIAIAIVGGMQVCSSKNKVVIVRDTRCECPCDGNTVAPEVPLDERPAEGKNISEVKR